VIDDLRPDCKFIICAADLGTAAVWAARADLGLREWTWLPGPELRVFRLIDADEAESLAPRRSWEQPRRSPGDR
jgi:hypothetical protein